MKGRYRQLFGEVYDRVDTTDKVVALTFDALVPRNI
jgi:hypothetical protein